jgi:hypothetical protein
VLCRWKRGAEETAADHLAAALDALRPAVNEAVARVTGASPVSVSRTGELGGPLAARVVPA